MGCLAANKPKDEVVMKLTIDLWHNFRHVFADKAIFLEAQRILNCVVTVQDYS